MCDGIICDGFIYKYLWDELATIASVAHFHYRGHGRSGLPVAAAAIGITDAGIDMMPRISAVIARPDRFVVVAVGGACSSSGEALACGASRSSVAMDSGLCVAAMLASTREDP